MTILRRFQIQYPSTTAWVDITDRVIGDVRFTEGRNLSLLGGPLPPAVPATLTATLDNATGYFTKGAGRAFGPGARFRLQWRATTNDGWITRYIGRLSEQRIRFQGSSRIPTRWYGALIHLTGGNLTGRTYGNQTAPVILGAMCDVSGVPGGDRDFDADATLVALSAGAGYAGVIQLSNLVNGFVYDTPDGKIRFELPPSRDAKTVSARYSDVPVGNEIGIPPPEVLTNPFGIVNQVDGELRVFSPETGAVGRDYVMPDALRLSAGWPGWTRFTATVPLGFLPSGGIATTDYSISYRAPYSGSPGLLIRPLDYPDLVSTGALTQRGSGGNIEFDIELRNFRFEAAGDVLELTFEHRHRRWQTGFPVPTTWGPSPVINLTDITATVLDLYATVQQMETYPYSEIDAGSQAIFGVQRRSAPLIHSQFVVDILTFDPDLAELRAAVKADLARYSVGRDAFIIETTAATVAERTSLLARRLSDKIGLRLAGESQIDIDENFFVEAIETVIDPVGNVAQRLHVAEVPPPPLVLPGHAELSMTSGTAFTATLPAATGGTPPYTYVLEGYPPGLSYDETTRVLSGTPD